MTYFVTKTYGHERGLSCCFRQWRADSHCSYLHGYALKISITFGAYALDARNWVIDFGGLKDFKKTLDDTFDHTLVIAEDDPHFEELLALEQDFSLAKIVVLPNVGCEAFAETIYEYGKVWLEENGKLGEVWIESVTVAEHDGNSATYKE